MLTGIDIVQISRMVEVVEKSDERLERLFSPREIAYCRSKGRSAAASFAGHYAAKEAFFKALGQGFRKGAWRDVEVCHDQWGAPFFKFYGYYASEAKDRSPRPPALSISHDGDYAVAQVIWES